MSHNRTEHDVLRIERMMQRRRGRGLPRGSPRRRDAADGGFEGRITVIGDEAHPPYDRPPLSKRLLAGEWEPDRIALRKPDDMASLDVEWRQGVAATGLDLRPRGVVLADGSSVRFDGADRWPPARRRAAARARSDHDHVVVLRTLDDSLALRRRRIGGGGKRVVVIGAGFIGLEVAATARQARQRGARARRRARRR